MLDEPALRTRIASVIVGILAALGDRLARRRSRRAWATSSATAHDARRAITESARLVRMIGTFAPSTMPAASAWARMARLFASMLPLSRLGTMSTFARPATGESIFLIAADSGADGVVERQRAVEHAARDLAAVGHLAQRRRLDGRGDLRVDRLDGRQDRDAHLGEAQRVAEIDRVLHDVDLVLERRARC